MSISTLFRYRSEKEHVSTNAGLQKPAILSRRSAEMALLAGFFRRRHGKSASVIDTGHLNDHVLKDIGLDRTDFTIPG